MVVDLEVSQQQAGAFSWPFIEAEGLLEAQNSGVELAGCGQVVGPQSDVSDADDRRAGYRSCLRAGAGLGQ
jgi:hypothetical protein